MANLTRDFFIALSNNELLNKGAKKWGFRLGAEQFVAGTEINSVLKSIKELNSKGISCTVDNLGEFITERHISIAAKEQITTLLHNIHKEELDCHISVKLTQLGLDIDEDFCVENMKEVVSLANSYDIFVNIDTEDYAHYEQTLRILDILHQEYKNVGTVMQSYLYRTEEDMEKLKDVRLRIVKGAYKESEEVAFQTKEEIDANFLKLAKKRLLNKTFTSIATHDHNLINELKQFVKDKNIDHSTFEFQMLYGFRTDMQQSLRDDGYLFCTYLPFGEDWYGYFMRRLAERPQNVNLIMKDKLYTTDNKLKKGPIIAVASIFAVLSLLLLRRKK